MQLHLGGTCNACKCVCACNASFKSNFKAVLNEGIVVGVTTESALFKFDKVALGGDTKRNAGPYIYLHAKFLGWLPSTANKQLCETCRQTVSCCHGNSDMATRHCTHLPLLQKANV